MLLRQLRPRERLQVVGLSLGLLLSSSAFLAQASGLSEVRFFAGMAVCLIALVSTEGVLEEGLHLRERKSRLLRGEVDRQLLLGFLLDRTPFVLYLRDFASGRARTQERVNEGGSTPWSQRRLRFGSATACEVVSSLRGMYSVVGLDNPAEIGQPRGLVTAYVDDDGWELAFALLARRASWVILDAALGTSEGVPGGIGVESSHLVARGGKRLVVVGTESDLVVMAERFGGLLSSAALVCRIDSREGDGARKLGEQLGAFVRSSARC